MIIFEKYELTEQGQKKNINTGNFLKVEEKPNGRFVKIVVEGKTKRINLNDYINQPEEVVEETVEEVNVQSVETNETNESVETNETTQNDNNENSQDIQVNETTNRRKSSRKYKIVVTEMDDTKREFKTFKAANDYYGLRKDYLNYCITEKFQKMLDKANLKKVEKVMLEQ